MLMRGSDRGLGGTGVVMTVTPENQFFEHEESQNARQQPPCGDVVAGSLLENMRQQIEKHHTEQRADGIAHKQRDQPWLHAPRHRGGEQRRKRTADKTGQDDVGECHG